MQRLIPFSLNNLNRTIFIVLSTPYHLIIDRWFLSISWSRFLMRLPVFRRLFELYRTLTILLYRFVRVLQISFAGVMEFYLKLLVTPRPPAFFNWKLRISCRNLIVDRILRSQNDMYRLDDVISDLCWLEWAILFTHDTLQLIFHHNGDVNALTIHSPHLDQIIYSTYRVRSRFSFIIATLRKTIEFLKFQYGLLGAISPFFSFTKSAVWLKFTQWGFFGGIHDEMNVRLSVTTEMWNKMECPDLNDFSFCFFLWPTCLKKTESLIAWLYYDEGTKEHRIKKINYGFPDIGDWIQVLNTKVLINVVKSKSMFFCLFSFDNHFTDAWIFLLYLLHLYFSSLFTMAYVLWSGSWEAHTCLLTQIDSSRTIAWGARINLTLDAWLKNHCHES